MVSFEKRGKIARLSQRWLAQLALILRRIGRRRLVRWQALDRYHHWIAGLRQSQGAHFDHIRSRRDILAESLRWYIFVLYF
jgi:hypothetical protein